MIKEIWGTWWPGSLCVSARHFKLCRSINGYMWTVRAMWENAVIGNLWEVAIGLWKIKVLQNLFKFHRSRSLVFWPVPNVLQSQFFCKAVLVCESWSCHPKTTDRKSRSHKEICWSCHLAKSPICHLPPRYGQGEYGQLLVQSPSTSRFSCWTSNFLILTCSMDKG